MCDDRIGTVYINDGAYGGEGSGSGFFIDDEGTFVTNYHVIEFADKIQVKTTDGGTYAVNKVVQFSEKLDLAILKVAVSGNKYFELCTTVTRGEAVYAAGSPLGSLDGSFTSGVVSSVSRTIGAIDCIQMDAAISHGNSGGPLLNKYGQVVGINSYSFTRGTDLNLAINVKMLDELPEPQNFSINDYIEWWRGQINISYRPTVADDVNSFRYSLVNTYQSKTGTECICHFNDLDGDWYNGYDSDYLFYVYNYNKATYDSYVSYIKDLGFEYQPKESMTENDGNLSVYYNSASNLKLSLWITNEHSECFGGEYLVIFIFAY